MSITHPSLSFNMYVTRKCTCHWIRMSVTQRLSFLPVHLYVSVTQTVVRLLFTRNYTFESTTLSVTHVIILGLWKYMNNEYVYHSPGYLPGCPVCLLLIRNYPFQSNSMYITHPSLSVNVYVTNLPLYLSVYLYICYKLYLSVYKYICY